MSRMEQLWAPWRLAYVTGEKIEPPPVPTELKWLPNADHECFLCRGAADSNDRANLIVARGKACLTILNRFPYNNGHLLVAPLQHKSRLDQLSDAEQLEIVQTITAMSRLIETRLSAEGFNIGVNLGRVAGAGLPGHLHWHIVPRWHGDVNFMPSIAGVKAIPQSLDTLWEILTEEEGARS
jgi:ATP adenylyltransferase